MSVSAGHSLFRQLLGSKADREVSLSKAFAACFHQSDAFQTALRKWSRHGPHYYKWFDDGGPYHFLAFSLRDEPRRAFVGAELVFPEPG